MKRIFHISNRVDIPEHGVATAGGLDEAIADAPEGYDVVRFGWSGKIVDKDDYKEEDAVRTVTRGHITYITYDMTKEDLDGFYSGTANSFLWPLFHFRTDVATPGFNKDDNKVYDRVNQDVAERAKKFIQPGDMVMVHDYHFIKAGKHLTSGENAISNPLGFFLHIPTPNSDLIEELDRPQQLYVYDLMSHLYDYDFVGLQSRRDVKSLHELIGQTANPRDTGLFETQTFRSIPNARGYHTTFGAFPVAGNTEKYSKLAKDWVDRAEVRNFMQKHTPDGIVDAMSVDRLDYSKGLVAKARGVGRWMSEYAERGEKIHLLQVAPPGRTDVRAYQDEIMKARTSFEDANEMFGKQVATLYLDKVQRHIHLGLARNSNIGLVTPLRDGFNLYVGEYIAAQEGRDRPGIPVVSKYAGVAAVLNGSIVTVDPRRPDDVAWGIQSARQMSAGQRQDMNGRALEIQNAHTNQGWQMGLIEATKESAARRVYGSGATAVELNRARLLSSTAPAFEFPQVTPPILRQ